jgi:hypothetical protein
MTPKEKAQEMFNKMYLVDDVMGNYPMCFDTAKKCAEIAIEEIIKTICYCYPSNKDEISFVEYWEKVKSAMSDVQPYL